MKSIHTDKKLVIAGGSSDADAFANELKELAKGDDRIIFTGFVQGQLLDELYSNAFIYTLPSDLEGMPLSLLEAMESTSIYWIPIWRVLEGSVKLHLVNPYFIKQLPGKKSDVNDLKDKLEWLLSHEDAVHTYKENATDFICHKYSWDNVVDKTMELYK